MGNPLISDPFHVQRWDYIYRYVPGRGEPVQSRVTLFFEGDVVITGDVALGQAFRDLLLAVDIDWEENLSRFTGDVLAHQLGNAVRSGQHWARQSRHTLKQDAAEYLQEEGRLLIAGDEMAGYLGAVDTLREDVDRLTARVQRLGKRLHSND